MSLENINKNKENKSSIDSMPSKSGLENFIQDNPTIESRKQAYAQFMKDKAQKAGNKLKEIGNKEVKLPKGVSNSLKVAGAAGIASLGMSLSQPAQAHPGFEEHMTEPVAEAELDSSFVEVAEGVAKMQTQEIHHIKASSPVISRGYTKDDPIFKQSIIGESKYHPNASGIDSNSIKKIDNLETAKPKLERISLDYHKNDYEPNQELYKDKKEDFGEVGSLEERDVFEFKKLDSTKLKPKKNKNENKSNEEENYTDSPL